MQAHTAIPYLQPPAQLSADFLNFAQKVNQLSKEKGGTFSEEELSAIFEGSFSGKVRATFYLWLEDLNKIIDGINLILGDLAELRHDKYSLKGNPVVRSEFLLQSFFGEFFRIKEVSKIFIKYLTTVSVFNKQTKEAFTDFYFTAFDWVYEIRNNIVHLGVSLRDRDASIDLDWLDELNPTEKKKFISLISEANTRENTVEIQCAVWMRVINSVMDSYMGFQTTLNNTLADLIIAFEESNLTIKVSANTD